MRSRTSSEMRPKIPVGFGIGLSERDAVFAENVLPALRDGGGVGTLPDVDVERPRLARNQLHIARQLRVLGDVPAGRARDVHHAVVRRHHHQGVRTQARRKPLELPVGVLERGNPFLRLPAIPVPRRIDFAPVAVRDPRLLRGCERHVDAVGEPLRADEEPAPEHRVSQAGTRELALAERRDGDARPVGLLEKRRLRLPLLGRVGALPRDEIGELSRAWVACGVAGHSRLPRRLTRPKECERRRGRGGIASRHDVGDDRPEERRMTAPARRVDSGPGRPE